ncbi:MAG TPA: hypothetical protein VFO60_02770 [Candidatus Dormibacteraeota bacterium]|nr:hypothetical protein [Candidatus Dormibacteraeota bacterium]
MASTSISEIVEISNRSNDAYFMYVWDNAHEGRYTSYTKDEWVYPNEGKWYRIPPQSHLRADDCGLPDGGKAAGKDRTRVIFKAASANQAPAQGDPDRGLRINRVSLGDGKDAILFRDNATGAELKSIPIPNVMHQSLSLHIDDHGARFEQTDITASGESQLQAAGQVIGEAFKTGAEIFLEVIKRIPAA